MTTENKPTAPLSADELSGILNKMEVIAQVIEGERLPNTAKAVARPMASYIDRETDEHVCSGCNEPEVYRGALEPSQEEHKEGCIVLRARAMLAASPSSAAVPSVPVQDERAEFEAWGRKNCGMDDESLGRRPSGDYSWGRTCDMYEAWQARAALSTSGAQASAANAGELISALRERHDEYAEIDRLLRASVPEHHQDAVSPVACVQNYIAELEAELADLRAQLALKTEEADAWSARWLKDSQLARQGQGAVIGYVERNQLDWLRRNTSDTASVQLWRARAPIDAVEVYLASPAQASAAPAYWNSQRKMIERAIIGLRDGWATRKYADDALATLARAAPEPAPAASQSNDRQVTVKQAGTQAVEQPADDAPLRVDIRGILAGLLTKGWPDALPNDPDAAALQTAIRKLICKQPADDARDAARYRYIASSPAGTIRLDSMEWVPSYINWNRERPLEPLVDAAMQSTKGATDGAAAGA